MPSEDGTNWAHKRSTSLNYKTHIYALNPDETPSRGRETVRSVCTAGCTYQDLEPGLPEDLDAEHVCGNCARIVRARKSDATDAKAEVEA